MDTLMTEILIGVYVATNGLRVLTYMPRSPSWLSAVQGIRWLLAPGYRSGY